jgi:ribosomal protein S18 acetylase RimI-like enzyme
MKKWIGTGIGSALMQNAVSTAIQLGFDTLWLGVWKQNPRAIRFYKSKGFVIVGEQDFLLGADVQHDYVLALPLP